MGYSWRAFAPPTCEKGAGGEKKRINPNLKAGTRLRRAPFVLTLPRAFCSQTLELAPPRNESVPKCSPFCAVFAEWWGPRGVFLRVGSNASAKAAPSNPEPGSPWRQVTVSRSRAKASPADRSKGWDDLAPGDRSKRWAAVLFQRRPASCKHCCNSPQASGKCRRENALDQPQARPECGDKG